MSLKTVLNSTFSSTKFFTTVVVSAPSRFLFSDLQLLELASGPT